MTMKPLHQLVSDACDGDLGWIWHPLTEEWVQAQVHDDHVECHHAPDIDIETADAQPWWPIDIPPYDICDENHPTHLVRFMDGSGAVTFSMKITDPDAGERLFQSIRAAFAEVGKFRV